jgi:glutaredoxin 3
MMRATVWSKDQCGNCVMAKNLLRNKGVEFEERNISQGQWTREQLLAAVPNARTLPQVILDGNLIGGYDQLKKHFESKS